MAATRFTGLLVPSDLLRMSRIPASSSTARTPPPAITPVPSEAGFSRTLPAPERPVTWWVIVVRYLGTRKRFFLASSTAFWMATGTSLAFPCPTPDGVDLVAHDHEGREREAPAALDDLRDAVDLDDPLVELEARPG